MKERLQKILSARGVASRRKAEEMITQGRVACNGRVCVLGDTADPSVDKITVDGQELPNPQENVYIMLHKPRGYVTTMSDECGRKDVCQLVADCGTRVYPVGRLDMDSEGLLLFTNDGTFANRMMHPRNEVNKTYLATVTGYSDDAMTRLQRPMTLDGYLLKKPEVSCVRTAGGDRATIQITIHEGKNRQVRKMFEACGCIVKRLERIREAGLNLGHLPRGKWRKLSESEVNMLKNIGKVSNKPRYNKNKRRGGKV